MLYLKTDNSEQLWIKFQFTNIVSSKKINESVISCEQCCRLKSLRGRWSPLSWEKELLNPLLKIGRKTDERTHFFLFFQTFDNQPTICSIYLSLVLCGKRWFKGFTNIVEFQLKFNLALLSHSYILTASSVEDRNWDNSLSLQMLRIPSEVFSLLTSFPDHIKIP